MRAHFLSLARFAALPLVVAGCGFFNKPTPPGPAVDPAVVIDDRRDVADFIADPLTGGFVVIAADEKTAGIAPFRFTHPWTQLLREPGLQVPLHLVPLVTDPSGHWLMVQSLQGDSASVGTILWDRRDQKIVFRQDGFSRAAAFNRDGSKLALSDDNGLALLEVPGGKALAKSGTLAISYDGHGMAWHPRDDALVFGGMDYLGVLTGGNFAERHLGLPRRDQAQWEFAVQHGVEETGFHPTAMYRTCCFTDDGEFLLVAMDRGLGIYHWSEVMAAKNSLPRPAWWFDAELVDVGISRLKMIYGVVFDPQRRLILWTGLEGKIQAFDLTTQMTRTVLVLRKDCCLVRLVFSPDYKILAGTLAFGVKGYGDAGANPRLVLLDYEGLLKEAGKDVGEK